MKLAVHALVVLLGLLLGAPAWGQIGTVNPNTPVPGTTPFGSQPHPLNNPYPTLPGAGVSGTGGYGVPFRQFYMPPQSVPIEVFVQQPEGVPDVWQTQYAELPGYYVTETTLGYIYPDRWMLVTPAKGIYQWQRVPSEFRRK